ncbi:hypothetical protein GCM10009127_04770 [Alteraurantiacibacter aestuarii]|uniref:PilZ domain-containing protein n=1 Tax=Alteraurantiacibacter aestuarii TaxID=650004 RepID=A0A844ZL28_9SPHN|nr:hypothetical protein [Alteraurantiacibacter aestuarii]MXO88273.1 hypothetical protein [Alteraurantiacibacter aestuarii]
MPSRKVRCKTSRIGAQCDLDRGSFAVALSDITPDGCSCEAPVDWEGDLDFLHLKIAGRIDINGRVLWQEGKRASIRFFGQIHPSVVDELGRLAA